MAVIALGYIGIRSDRLDDWSDFAGRLVGMQEIDHGGSTRAFRMDDRKQRFAISDEPGDALGFTGWEVEQPDDLRFFADRLENAGIAVHQGSSALADRRFVADLIHFEDPDGNRIEFFHGPMLTADPFVPGRPIQGFRTNPVGMGHAVLHVRDAEALMPFYRDLLGFHVTDFGLKPYPLYFFHVNGRHHSLAMVGSGNTGIHHIMVEFLHLDDVGQAYDLALLEKDMIGYTLGRHTNDFVTSFYAQSPSDFFVEFGWGSRIIDPQTWQPHETTGGPSFWGHDRLKMPENLRQEFSDMRIGVAQQGLRTPPIADCPWLYGELAGRGG